MHSRIFYPQNPDVIDYPREIIDYDGAMSRISGWENLTEGEREKSLRLIAKRNKIRKESLLQAEVEQTFSSQQQEGNTQNQAQGIDGETTKSIPETLAIEYNQS